MSKHEISRLQRGALTTAVVSALVPAVAYPAAGRVQFAIGDVKGIDKEGNERRLRRGARLEEGDTIRTARGRAQIRFSDGAFTSLQPDTEFRIDGYAYDEKKTEESRGFFSLLKGGLRTITGAIGKLRERSYRLSTPVATIGIRGTEYTAVLGNSLSVNVGLGTITASNDAGTLVIANGESAFIAGAGSYPLLTPDKPVLPPPVVGQRTQDGDEDTGDYQFGDDFRSLRRLLRNRLPTGSPYAIAVAYGDDTEGGFTLQDDDGPGTAGPAAAATTQAPSSGSIPNGVDVYSREPVFGVFNQASELVAFATGGATGQIGALADGAVRDAGVHQGVIGWGRSIGRFAVRGSEYDSANPTETVVASLSENQGHHYVIGRPTPMADMAGQTGNVAFNLVGATRPTINDGSQVPGFVDSGRMVAHFGVQKVSMDLQFTLGGDAYHVDTAAGGNLLSIDGGRISGSGGFTTISGSSGFGTSVEGYFAGTNASHMGISYKVDSFGDYVTGAAAFGRAGPGPPPPQPR